MKLLKNKKKSVVCVIIVLMMLTSAMSVFAASGYALPIGAKVSGIGTYARALVTYINPASGPNIDRQEAATSQQLSVSVTAPMYSIDYSEAILYDGSKLIADYWWMK